MEISDELAENIIFDFRKKDIPKCEKAKFIKEFMTKENLSLREFSKKYNLPKTTVHDWLDYLNTSEDEIKTFKDMGYSDTSIRTILAQNHKLIKQEVDKKGTEMDRALEESIKKLSKYIRHPITSDYSLDLIIKLRDVVNRIKLTIEKDSSN
jgi:DNA-binding transcriptional regulator YiaG